MDNAEKCCGPIVPNVLNITLTACDGSQFECMQGEWIPAQLLEEEHRRYRAVLEKCQCLVEHELHFRPDEARASGERLLAEIKELLEL